MYLELFQLEEHPFRLGPDPNFLYLSEQHARALAYIESTLWFTDGFVVITGEIGCGKTTLIEKFLSELDDNVTVARIAQTQITAVQFLQTLLARFDYKPFKMKKAELLDTITRHLEKLLEESRKVVIVIDEAQNLDQTVLEEIRLLSGLSGGAREKVLSIILAGQPELSDTLDRPNLEQLSQRTRLRFHLRPIAEDEIGTYVEHRLEVAGSGGRQIFDPATYPMLYKYTGGVPRLINTLCDTAMLCAFAGDRDTVGVEEIKAAISELQWEDYKSRTNRMAVLKRSGSGRSATDAVAKLVVTHKDEDPEDHPVTQGRLILGRTSDNDVQIDSRFVSRHHAQIVTYGETSTLEDLNSTNGIYMDGKRVKKRKLIDGDVFVIGEHELQYLRPDHTSTSTQDE